MKIKIHSFGPILDYEFDLDKDFHLIVGENSVGKSYAITIVYLILKVILDSRGRIEFFSFVEADDIGFLSSSDLDWLRSIPDGQEKRVNDLMAASANELFSWMLVDDLRAAIDNTFESSDVLVNQRSNDDLKISLIFEECTIVLGIVDKHVAITEFDLNGSYYVKTIRQSRERRKAGQIVTIYNNVKDSKHVEHSFKVAVLQIFFGVAREVTSQCSAVHYLPASRSGLYQALSAFGQIIAELSKSRSFLTKKIELPNISEPLSDYFLKLSSITVSKRRFEESRINQIAELIESQILNGKVEFDSKTKRIMFLPNDTSLRLDLSVTSSMVSELAPIVSYLRYILTEPPRRAVGLKRRIPRHAAMLIIEEPEAHLHPKVQIELVSIFSLLVHMGVKVVVTSHSNYIFNKASNLIIGKQLDPRIVSAVLFRMEDRGSVSRCLSIDEYGIDDENFVVVSEQLFEEKADMMEEHVFKN